MVNIPCFTGFYTSQVVQYFFHQQYVEPQTRDSHSLTVSKIQQWLESMSYVVTLDGWGLGNSPKNGKRNNGLWNFSGYVHLSPKIVPHWIPWKWWTCKAWNLLFRCVTRVWWFLSAHGHTLCACLKCCVCVILLVFPSYKLGYSLSTSWVKPQLGLFMLDFRAV